MHIAPATPHMAVLLERCCRRPLQSPVRAGFGLFECLAARPFIPRVSRTAIRLALVSVVRDTIPNVATVVAVLGRQELRGVLHLAGDRQVCMLCHK